jgi:DNA-binding transcriptional LysR family regulator
MERGKFAERLQTFVEVCRLGSFSAAARRMSVNPSSVSRQIDALESEIGATLVTRSTRAIALTSAGQRLLDRARALLDDIADVRAEVAGIGGEVTGLLRVAALPTFGKRYVAPALQGLLLSHPGLRVELDLTERMADPVADRLDLVIRVGRLADSSLISTKLAADRRRLVASPRYLHRFGAPASIEDLRRRRLINKMHGPDVLRWSELIGRTGRADAPSNDSFRCDDFEALRMAAIEGVGIALLPSWVVGEDIGSGALSLLMPDVVAARIRGGGVYALRPLADPPPAVVALTAALRQTIGSPPVWERRERGAD